MRRVMTAVAVWMAASLAASGSDIQALRVLVLRGEGSFNDVRTKTAGELMVQVLDDGQRPVSGAQVTFTAPFSGASGTFAAGDRKYSVTSGADGRAAAEGFKPNSVEGRFPIHVTAEFQGKSNSVVIWQNNTLAAARKGGGYKKVLIMGLISGGVTVALLAARSGGGSSPTAPASQAPVSISVGTLTVGPPR